MLLNTLIVNPRLRSPWAAIDLGIPIAKRFWLKYASIWLVLAIPVFLLSIFLLSDDLLWLSVLIVWWFKPVFERPILYMLSKHLFGQPVTIRETLKNYKEWLSIGWIYSITLRRFSFARSFLMSVTLLEKLTGKAYSQRTGILSSKGGSEAFWLTTTLVHVEMFLPLALFTLITFFYPILNFDELISLEQSQYIILLTNSISVLTMAVVAPFYVSSGFMLYICRRIELEAWDIEICFHDLANKLWENK
ncbi:MAG: hypothetical protein ACRBCI_05030 [Cellvibrionaceae bacterium]